MINNFKMFLESEEQKNIDSLIAVLPKGHQKLLDGYKVKLTPKNTLKNDNDHIGYIYKDKIVVAAPWNYSRSMTFAHEIAHLVYEYKMTPKLKKAWVSLLKNTIKDQKDKMNKNSKKALDQSSEELFAMAYAATYVKHPPETYVNDKWQDFILTKVPD